MNRDLKALAAGDFDVVIVGGGIYGAALLREAALRGLSAALVEQGDFCGATSANSLKTIHGGLRYLQQLDLVRMRESIFERRALLRTAPHLVLPLPCLMPTLRQLMKSRAAMFAAMLANDIISWDRNRGCDPERMLAHGCVISKAKCLEIVPGLPPDTITGGAVWNDASAYSTERVVLAMLASAADEGAVAANHVACTGFLTRERALAGVRAVDRLTGQELDIRGRIVINAAGPWADRLLELLPERVAPILRGLAFGMNFVLKRWPVRTHAVGLVSRARPDIESRLLFFAPWKGYTVAGTYYRRHEGDPGSLRATDRDIELLLADINAAHPAARVTREDVLMIHGGLLPARSFPSTPGAEPKLANHYALVDHAARDGIGGLISVVGVKYTTARHVAEKTVDLALARLGRPRRPSPTAERPLAGGDIRDFGAFVRGAEDEVPAGVTPQVLRHLIHHYGSAYRAVLDAGERRADMLAPLWPGALSTAAEVTHAVRAEMAMTLPDIVYRRTDLGTAAIPPEPVLRRCAELAGAELGWDEPRKAAEIRKAGNLPWLA